LNAYGIGPVRKRMIAMIVSMLYTVIGTTMLMTMTIGVLSTT